MPCCSSSSRWARFQSGGGSGGAGGPRSRSRRACSGWVKRKTWFFPKTRRWPGGGGWEREGGTQAEAGALRGILGTHTGIRGDFWGTHGDLGGFQRHIQGFGRIYRDLEGIWGRTGIWGHFRGHTWIWGEQGDSGECHRDLGGTQGFGGVLTRLEDHRLRHLLPVDIGLSPLTWLQRHHDLGGGRGRATRKGVTALVKRGGTP